MVEAASRNIEFPDGFCCCVVVVHGFPQIDLWDAVLLSIIAQFRRFGQIVLTLPERAGTIIIRQCRFFRQVVKRVCNVVS